MEATIVEIPSDVFKFSGQAHLDTFALELERLAFDLDRYYYVAVNGLRLSLEAIRKKTNDFTYWQRRKRTGRPPYEERTLLVSFLVQQLLGFTFRETEGVLKMDPSYFRLDRVPDHSTLSRKLSSTRWTPLLKWFFYHVLAPLPRPKVIFASNVTW